MTKNISFFSFLFYFIRKIWLVLIILILGFYFVRNSSFFNFNNIQDLSATRQYENTQENKSSTLEKLQIDPSSIANIGNLKNNTTFGNAISKVEDKLEDVARKFNSLDTQITKSVFGSASK